MGRGLGRGRFALDTADRILQRKPLPGDVGLCKRRIHAAELIYQRRTRAVIDSTPRLARIRIEVRNRTR
jgi:hypothetical protein